MQLPTTTPTSPGGHGYHWVPLDGFAAFAVTLASAVWAAPALPDPLLTGGLDADAVDRLSLRGQWKLRLARALREAAAVDSGAPALTALIAEWDRAQGQFELALQLAAGEGDAALSGAAARVRAALLPATADGRSRMNLPAAQKVDYGEAQVARAKEPTVKTDLDALGLASRVRALKSATEALAPAAGTTPGVEKQSTVRAAQGVAHRNCIAAFNEVHSAMSSILALTVASPTRNDMLARFETLLTLLERYPPPPHAPASAPAPATGATTLQSETTAAKPARSPAPKVRARPVVPPPAKDRPAPSAKAKAKSKK